MSSWLRKFAGLGEDAVAFAIDPPTLWVWEDKPLVAVVSNDPLPPADEADVWSHTYRIVEFNFSFETGQGYTRERSSMMSVEGESSGVALSGVQVWQSNDHWYSWNTSLMQSEGWSNYSFRSYESYNQQHGIITPTTSIYEGARVWHAESFSVDHMPGVLVVSNSDLYGASVSSGEQLGDVSTNRSVGLSNEVSSTTLMGESWFTVSNQTTRALWKTENLDTPTFGVGTYEYTANTVYNGYSFHFGQDGRLVGLSASQGEHAYQVVSFNWRIGDVSGWNTTGLTESHGDSFSLWQGGWSRDYYESRTVTWNYGVQTPDAGAKNEGSLTVGHYDSEVIFNGGPVARLDIGTDTIHFDVRQTGWEGTVAGENPNYIAHSGDITKTTQVQHFTDGHTTLLVQYSAAFHSESSGTPVLSALSGVPYDQGALAAANDLNGWNKSGDWLF